MNRHIKSPFTTNSSIIDSTQFLRSDQLLCFSLLFLSYPISRPFLSIFSSPFSQLIVSKLFPHLFHPSIYQWILKRFIRSWTYCSPWYVRHFSVFTFRQVSDIHYTDLKCICRSKEPNEKVNSCARIININSSISNHLISSLAKNISSEFNEKRFESSVNIFI